MSGFSEAKSAGFALAALLLDDRELQLVRGQLDATNEQLVRQHTQVGAAERASLVTRLLTYVRPPLLWLPTRLPARFAALLARSLPAAEARRALADVPLARAGFEPADDLLPRLLRIARHASARAGNAETRS